VSVGLEPPFGVRDRGNLAALIEGAPDQVERALAATRALHSPHPGPDLLAVGGLGGSAIAADLAAALYYDRLPRPMVTVRDYHWPPWVSPASLAVLSSYSGETEETLSLYEEAAQRGVPRLALTTGGTLGALCARDGVTYLRLPGGLPPRQALFFSWACLTMVLSKLGWVEEPAPAWHEAVERLRARIHEWGPDCPEPRNAAKRLARELAGRFVLMYAGTERMAPVATRMRNQLNENAKLLGHSAVAPELNHNEIVGWERLGSLRERLVLLILSDREDAPEIGIRLRLTAEYAARQGVPVHTVHEEEGGRLARMASMVQLGDYVSFYLALLNGIDPTPIPSIDEFKRRLAEWRAQHAR